ncbi:L,D-transpeptidase [Moraxella cuniculi]|uniref:Probable L,D-transpeptidase YbiS n=1 Tax=Moraxella cuniculi TaxID=34061 RepID=A0A3S4R560_9GAMM|nr:L,D-transpeptidase [Moraxella cuniculi]VEG13087.1 Probable L,D-transpeptidase YbiS precursor [Moraxella cuniculi]
MTQTITTEQTQLIVDCQVQTLQLWQNQQLVRTFSISTAKNGTGQLSGSGCTPLGRHKISEKFGEGLPINAVFVARQFTGELYDEALAEQFANRDWILARILWLEGLEEGYNRGENAQGICVDSKSRYIYIHGTPDTEPMGVPLSHGCIRMRNQEILWLFEQVEVGAQVVIR